PKDTPIRTTRLLMQHYLPHKSAPATIAGALLCGSLWWIERCTLRLQRRIFAQLHETAVIQPVFKALSWFKIFPNMADFGL
ncbi:hypothetical protein J7E24_02815, partial [Hymenobacter sp. ISL-91]|uniref:hypothetical protein n=1 Tax=Hymenobacter sp. ISL-91 TaxID=2819151 RepID=UPI001BE7CB4F